MKVLIVEDEILAAERLQLLLQDYDKDIEIVAMLDSVEETVNYLRTKPHPDVLMLDIHLSDGRSFEIFQRINYTRPVIFTTAYDEYALDAFKMTSIDYILKPVTPEALAAALNKLKNIAQTFGAINYQQLENGLTNSRFKERFLAKIGQRLFTIGVDSISFLYADNKTLTLTDINGHKYTIDGTIEKLETQLNPRQFYRINRSCIVSVDAIEQVRPYFTGRLRVWLKGGGKDDEFIISRDRVAGFKKWVEG